MAFNYWKRDLQASVVVFLVALPLCLGIALASGAPLAAGIYAGIIGGLIIGATSSSAISVSGPAAGLTVIVASAIHTLGSFEALAMAVFLSGLIQIIFGLLRGGVIGDYFPSSVIKGMLAAIGLILILKQLPHAVGYDADFMGDEDFVDKTGMNTFSQLMYSLRVIHPGAVIISFVSLAIMLSWEKLASRVGRFFQLIPGALIAVVVAILLNKLFSGSAYLHIQGDHLVSLPFQGGLSDFFAGIKSPHWSSLASPGVYSAAFTIAIVGSIESLLSVDAADKIDEQGRVTDKNRELFAQGLGNTISGLVGGLPVTAVIVRTSANANAGAKTKLSAIFHALWLFLCVVFIPHFLNLIPLSVLACVLLLVGYKLCKPDLMKKMYKRGLNQFVPFMVTIVAILFSNLLLGILIGIVVGFIFVIRSNIHKSMVLISEDNRYLIRFHKDVSFLQKAELQKMFTQIQAGSSLVIDGANAVFIDDDIVDAIEDYMKRAESQGITVKLKKSPLALCSLFKEV